MYSNELYHYGVKGMKWGVRRAQRKEARSAYRSAKDKAFRKYERDIHDIEKGYKRGQMLSKKDQAREAAVEKRYSSDVAKAKSDYKQAKQNIKNYGKSEDHLRSKQLKQKKLSEMSNAELKELNNRMQLESQYKNLKRQNVNAGQKFVKDVAYETSKQIASEYTKKYAKKGIRYVGDLRR